MPLKLNFVLVGVILCIKSTQNLFGLSTDRNKEANAYHITKHYGFIKPIYAAKNDTSMQNRTYCYTMTYNVKDNIQILTGKDSDVFLMSFGKQSVNFVEAKIFSMSGYLLASYNYFLNDRLTYPLDMKAFEDGDYFVELIIGERKTTQKIHKGIKK
jgi:hypothetical protein